MRPFTYLLTATVLLGYGLASLGVRIVTGDPALRMFLFWLVMILVTALAAFAPRAYARTYGYMVAGLVWSLAGMAQTLGTGDYSSGWHWFAVVLWVVLCGWYGHIVVHETRSIVWAEHKSLRSVIDAPLRG